MPYQGQAGDFRLMAEPVVDAIRQMPERRRFLRGMVAWVGFRQVPIEYRRAGRTSGRGASYPQLFRLALEAIASFSDVPLSIASYLGLLTASLSALAARRAARRSRSPARSRRAASSGSSSRCCSSAGCS